MTSKQKNNTSQDCFHEYRHERGPVTEWRENSKAATMKRKGSRLTKWMTWICIGDEASATCSLEVKYQQLLAEIEGW
jgi:hypothetical protein